MRHILNAGTVLLLLCAVVLLGLQIRDRSAGPEFIVPAGTSDEPIEDWERYLVGGHRMGLSDPPIILVEWGDFECPACRSFHAHLKAARQRFPADLAVVYRHFPLSYHTYARPAAIAAECSARQGAFEAYHDLLFENENWLGDAFVDFAREAGVPDLDAFEVCLQSGEADEAIEADLKAGREVGARGTPTVLLDGVYLGSPPDSVTLFRMIEEAIGR